MELHESMFPLPGSGLALVFLLPPPQFQSFRIGMLSPYPCIAEVGNFYFTGLFFNLTGDFILTNKVLFAYMCMLAVRL